MRNATKIHAVIQVPKGIFIIELSFACGKADRQEPIFIPFGNLIPIEIERRKPVVPISFKRGKSLLPIDKPPIIDPSATDYTDPLPQALVLTAIVISFGMTALIVVLALRSFLETGSDGVAMDDVGEDGLEARDGKARQ